MPELEWASDGQFVDRDRDIEVANDPEEGENTLYDVPEEAVEEYLDRPGWVRPDESDAADEEAGDQADEAQDEVDELLEGTNDEVADALETGEYDDRLDDIEERATRSGVQDAVEDRRDALEDEG